MRSSMPKRFETLELRRMLAGNTIDGPNADLIYNPTSGELTIDLADLESRSITAISLVNESQRFEVDTWAESEVGLFLPVRNGPSGYEGLIDRDDQEFQQASLGPVLLEGFFATPEEMAEFFDAANYTAGNRFDFDLIVAGIEAEVSVAETGFVTDRFLLGQEILVSGTLTGSSGTTVSVDVQSGSPSFVETDVDGNFEVVVAFNELGPKSITLSSDVASMELPISIVSDNPPVAFSEDLVDGSNGAVALYAANLDGDSDFDLLFAHSNLIGWLENDGRGRFSPHTIMESAEEPESIAAADLDGDGDLDVLSASKRGDEIFWHENLDGKGDFSEKKVISSLVDEGRAAVAIDVDNDGDLDVVSASLRDSKVAWYENTDGLGSFGDQQVISSDTLALSATASDLDGDGNQDLIVATVFDLVWFRNDDALFSEAKTVSRRSADRVVVADIDGDGDEDIAAVHADSVSWYRNIDGIGNFDTAVLVSDNVDGGSGIDAADIDADGDIDLATTSRVDNKVAWYQNVDGVGGFGEQQIVDENASGAWFVLLADLDNDQDSDIVASMLQESAIRWYESDLFGRQGESITGDANGDGSVNFLDFLALANNFGDSVEGGAEDGDFDFDGVVSFLDFLALANNFGKSILP